MTVIVWQICSNKCKFLSLLWYLWKKTKNKKKQWWQPRVFPNCWEIFQPFWLAATKMGRFFLQRLHCTAGTCSCSLLIRINWKQTLALRKKGHMAMGLQMLNVPFTPPSPSHLRLELNPAPPHQLLAVPLCPLCWHDTPHMPITSPALLLIIKLSTTQKRG